jgi:hypothetical protein
MGRSFQYWSYRVEDTGCSTRTERISPKLKQKGVRIGADHRGLGHFVRGQV